MDAKIRDALKDRAQQHGRSLEDEAKAILVAAVSPKSRVDWSKVTIVDSGRTGNFTRDEINDSYEAP